MDAFSIGVAGVSPAMQRFDAGARQTASSPSDLIQQVASRLEAKSDVQASAAVVKTADEMTGKLLDILA